jgi:uncharacterized protein
MNPFAILARHYEPTSPLYALITTHSFLVAHKARKLGEHLIAQGRQIDLDFVTEATLLHDIGVGLCDAPEILCHGKEPYIRHGVLGREVLEQEGLTRHALVCERHTGAGISRKEVEDEDLPLPRRDYIPVSIEEKLICVADKFYSKTPDRIWVERTPEEVRTGLSKWGQPSVKRWDALWTEIAGT